MAQLKPTNREQKQSIIMEGKSPPAVFERNQFIKLLTEVARRISREKQDDVAKSA